jgi:hypothetical protein
MKGVLSALRACAGESERAGIGVLEHAVLAHDDAFVGILDDEAVLLLARAQRRLRALALRDVAHERAEDEGPAGFHRPDGELDVELAAGAIERGGLHAPVEDPRRSIPQKPREAAVVGLAVLDWNDEVGEDLPDRFGARPAEHALGGAIPVEDHAGFVDGHHRVVGGVDEDPRAAAHVLERATGLVERNGTAGGGQTPWSFGFAFHVAAHLKE